MVPLVIPEMQRIHKNIDNLLYRSNLGYYEKARQYTQLQNRFLTYQHQLNSLREATIPLQPQERKQISNNVQAGNLPTVPTPVQEPLVIIPATPVETPAVKPTAKVAAPQALSMANSNPSPPSLHRS